MASTPTAADRPASLPCLNPSPSFWLSQPSRFLLSHCTTPELPSSADIVIVGSGITGASVARFLSEGNVSQSSTPAEKNVKPSVVMLEAREVCYGATGRNGGHCQPLLFDRSPEVADFEVRNVSTVHDYIKKHDIEDWTEWRYVTGCRLFYSDDEFKGAKDDIDELARVEPELRKLVKVVDCAAGTVDGIHVEGGVEGVLRDNRVRSGKGAGKGKEVIGLTLTQGAGQLWPYRYVTHVVEKLVKDGFLNLQTNTPVLAVESLSDDTYRQKIVTARGEIKAKHVILATNGYTSYLLPDLFTSLIVPVRCEMSALHPPTNSERLPNSYGMVGYDDGHPDHDDYLIQRPFYSSLPDSKGKTKQKGGHLMFGGGRSFAKLNCVGATEDDVVDVGEADYLRKVLPKMLDLSSDGSESQDTEAELVASHQWTGIKGYSRDNMPWVGKVLERSPAQSDNNNSAISWKKGLWLCAGYTGHGMPNASLCGKAIVDMIIKEERQKSELSFESICEDIVKAKGLPREYLITAERIQAASELPTVRETDEGLSLGKYLSQRSTTDQRKKDCEIM